MKTQFISRTLALAVLILMGYAAMGQNSSPQNSATMKTYLIEREVPDAGKLSPSDLKGISQTSCAVLDGMGPRIKWIHSYVTGNHIFCVYEAENEELIREHGMKGGFPVTSIREIAATISPATVK